MYRAAQRAAGATRAAERNIDDARFIVDGAINASGNGRIEEGTSRFIHASVCGDTATRLICPQGQYCCVKRHAVDISIILRGSQNARNARAVAVVVAKRSVCTGYIPGLGMDSTRKLVAIWVNS
jgi:hypothetical protein